MLTIGLNAKTATSITIDTLTRTAGYDRVDVQVSTRQDFQFVLAPIYGFVGAATAVLSDVNQANLYYIRARERVQASGVVLPWTAAIQVYTPVSVAQDPTPAAVMIRPAIIVVPECVAWSSLVQQAAYPAANLGSDAPSEQFWSGSFAGASIDFDTGGQPIDTVALLGTNLPVATNWQIVTHLTAAARTAGTGIQYNSGAVKFQASDGLPGRAAYHGIMRLPAARSEPFWRINFSGVGPPSNQIVIQYGVAGLARTAKNIAADKVETPLDYGSFDRLRDGTPDRRFGFRARRVEFEIAVMTEAQWETQFADLRQKAGLIDPILVVPNTRTGAFYHDRILYGPFASLRAQQPFTPRFTQQFSIESVI
jgi:hypothetical protein